MDKKEKQQKLLDWVKRKNAKVEPRKYDYQELWQEIEPFFIECEGDNELKFKIMCEATNYR